MNTLIISATSDLGRSISERLYSEGTSLQLTYRKEQDKENLKSTFTPRENQSISFLKYDALDPNGHTQLVSSLETIPDQVFICTGFMGDHEKAIKDELEMKKILESNFSGLAFLIHALSLKMKERGGTIIGISSVAGERGRRGKFFLWEFKKRFNYIIGWLSALLPWIKLKICYCNPRIHQNKNVD